MTKEKFNIGLVGPLPPPHGGMANQTKQLKKLLEREGIKVDFVQTNPPYYPLFIKNVKFIRAIPRLVTYCIQLSKTAGSVDIFHIMANSGLSWFLFACPAILIAKINNVSVIVNYRGGQAEEFFTKYIYLVQFFLRKVDVVIVPSGFLEKIFDKFGFETKIVPNIINLDMFNNYTHIHKTDEKINVLVTRGLEEIYDIQSAIEAAYELQNQYPDLTLTIAGSGPLEQELKNQVRARNLSYTVKFIGKVKNKDMPSVYQDADIVYNPSLVDNMPISLLEALACGVPIVSTDVGGIRYMVEHEKDALLVPPKSPKLAAESIHRILSDNLLKQRLIQNGREKIRQFEWNNIKPTLFSIYESVL